MLIVVDTARNELHFELAAQSGAETGGRGEETMAVPAELDIGERGRLLSLEVHLPEQAAHTIVIDDRTDPYARTARITVRCTLAPDGTITRVTVPRRGPDYELSYPSGNECWIDASGTQHCAITRL